MVYILLWRSHFGWLKRSSIDLRPDLPFYRIYLRNKKANSSAFWLDPNLFKIDESHVRSRKLNDSHVPSPGETLYDGEKVRTIQIASELGLRSILSYKQARRSLNAVSDRDPLETLFHSPMVPRVYRWKHWIMTMLWNSWAWCQQKGISTFCLNTAPVVIFECCSTMKKCRSIVNSRPRSFGR